MCLMFERKELKSNAKKALKSYGFWTAFITTFLASFLMYAGGGSSSAGTGPVFEAIATAAEDPSVSAGAIAAVTGLVIFGALLGLAISFAVVAFISGPAVVGFNRFFMEFRLGGSNISKLFWAFNKERYFPVVKTMFVYNLKIALWSLLFVVPGIIKSFEYFMVPYILAENPNIDRKRAFEISKAATQGEKMNIFIFELSFIGCILLGFIACGIGILFVEPYLYASYAELNQKLREKVLNNGYATASELPGFEG